MFSKRSRSVQAVCTLLSIYFSGVSDGLVKPCGSIIPESPVIPIGSNFTAFCILNPLCKEYGDIDADRVIWKMKTVTVPKEQYKVINQTVSSVTFNDTSTLVPPLTCNILVAGNIVQNIYGIHIQFGWPPDKPENLSCITYQKQRNLFSLTCTWEPGRITFRNTTYYLKSQWASDVCTDCISITNYSCSLPHPVFFVDLELWVEAKNDLGMAKSEPIVVDPVNFVKPLPPHNLTTRSHIPATVVNLSWENQFREPPLLLKFNIQYKITGSTYWNEIPLEDTESDRTAFNIQGLQPYTKYTFRIRCAVYGRPGYWSDWSKEVVGSTAEDEPSKGPAIWKKIHAAQSPEDWTLVLSWKELNPSEANGKIVWYNVSIIGKPPSSFPPESYNVNTTELTLNVQNGTYEVRITAHNSVGKSPPSVLFIPAINSKAPVKNVKAHPENGELWVEWTAPKDGVVKYIIEWCDQCDNFTEWQQEPGTTQRASLRGHLKPFVCYLITVYPLYANGQGEGQSTQAYLEQDIPGKGPTVQTKKLGKHEATLEWKPLLKEEQRGFIKYYTISYRIANGNETVVTVDPSKTEYKLSSLKSDTSYIVEMSAYTDKGGRSGSQFTFTTQRFGDGEIEAIVVPVCLAFLLITLLTVLFCFNKQDVIKKHIWPNVPDPSKSVIAQWSPQTPSKHFNSKEQIYPEGSFTDVSVVEIEADDKKSFSEQDLKPFDLLKKEKNASEGHSSGIGGSSCMSSPRQSVSDSDEGEPAQNTSSTVQYSTVVPNGYRDQTPSVQVFSRSESTQPLLDLEERPEDPQVLGTDNSTPKHHYFKQNCNPEETAMDESHLERIKQISPINEEDVAGLQAPETCGSGPERGEQGVALGAFYPSPKGPALRNETMRIDTVTEEEMPKCYLPQTVRQGGYMPQ
ncbi:interleukin-6 receptor subunit beta isoform X2 [Hemicordylus capensis]|uniref:interleukin-6 receptor subunit beta isoform X2 n=1 Tax=Hemicordylus capensis TaxID=884348 RepID=UPI00230437D1|nr:interleukin-6 receptor subunit beta isoform X2 [Hemicordylus capensis]